MVFSSTTFLFLFLPALLVAYFCRKGIRWRNGVLLVFSLIFYSFGEPVWVLKLKAAASYQYYRLVVKANHGGEHFQLSEML